MPSSDRIRTLLVDPDAERRAQLERVLQEGGLEVLAASDPAGAQRAAGVLAPELVIIALPAEPGLALVGISGAFQAPPRPPDAAAPRGRPSHAAGRPTLAELERRYALEILRETGGNKTRAAEILGIDRKTLYRLIDDVRANGTSPAPAATPPTT